MKNNGWRESVSPHFINEFHEIKQSFDEGQ
jgi:hypothetical protein